MKKNFKYAWLGAIALTGAMGFTACSSDNDVVAEKDVNPTYNPETKEVTTQFILNIASEAMPSTRQSAATVQKNYNFRGMKDAWLVGMVTGKDNSYLAPLTAANQSGLTIKQTYNLGELYGNGSIKNDPNDDDPNKTNENQSSHRVVELSLPTTTDAMLVYGRAIPASPADDMENGKVTYPTSAFTATTPNLENVKFSLVSRLGDNSTAYTNTLKVAQAILNRIMLSEVSGNPMSNKITRINITTGLSYTQQEDLPALTWRSYGAMTDAQITALGTTAPLQQNLAKAYKTIQDTYKSDAIHSGSAASICNVIKDVYAIANNVSNATATTDAELNGQRLADDIKLRIDKYFDNPTGMISLKDLGSASDSDNPMGSLLSKTTLTSSDFTGVTNDYLQAFPSVFGIPDGVAQLKFVEGLTLGADGKTIINGFIYKEFDDDQSLANLSAKLNPAKYMYPAELLYFDNSLLYVSDSEKAPSDYPDGYKTWDNYSWTGNSWAIGAVAATTRSVAVKNNINYGVSMLQTNVILDGTTFNDNHEASDGVIFTVDDVKKFKLKGVLIGDQYKEVGWNYLSTGDGDNKNFVIYDNKIADENILSSTSPKPNYTLVFDNYAGDTQSYVLVALEFKNESEKDIYGLGGMIPKNGTFYLAGKLDLGSKTIAAEKWPSTYAIPPYNTDGSSKEITRVFVQDFMTTATFKLGLNSLKKAYTTVPDLRSTQTSLGLSVDLNWREGLNFDDVVLGQ